MSSFAVESIQANLPAALLETYVDRTGESWAVIKPEAMGDVGKLLKEKGFRLFISMDAVDRLHLPAEEQDPRFEVLYFLKNLEKNQHARIKVRVNEGESVATISHIFQGAVWGERFVWDFYGVTFKGHSNMKRMLMYEEFQGHALRKDYPLRGRQPLTPERPIKDIFRGPGTNGVAD